MLSEAKHLLWSTKKQLLRSRKFARAWDDVKRLLASPPEPMVSYQGAASAVP
jgi:hypothetical protein